MNTFKNTLSVLENERLFTKYPQVISDIFEKVMWVDENPKEGIYKTKMAELKKAFFNIETLKDWCQFRKI